MGEQKAGEIVDGEEEFIPVGAGPARGTRNTAAEPGIIDQEIQTLGGFLDSVGETPHLGDGGKVSLQKFRGSAGGFDLGNESFAAPAVTAVHKNTPAAVGQPLCHHAAHAVGRAGNEGRLSIRFCHK